MKKLRLKREQDKFTENNWPLEIDPEKYVTL